MRFRALIKEASYRPERNSMADPYKSSPQNSRSDRYEELREKIEKRRKESKKIDINDIKPVDKINPDKFPDFMKKMYN